MSVPDSRDGDVFLETYLANFIKIKNLTVLIIEYCRILVTTEYYVLRGNTRSPFLNG